MYWYIESKKSIFCTREEGSATWVAIYCQKMVVRQIIYQNDCNSLKNGLKSSPPNISFQKIKENNENDMAAQVFSAVFYSSQRPSQISPTADFVGAAIPPPIFSMLCRIYVTFRNKTTYFKMTPFIPADGQAKSAQQLISTMLPFHPLYFPTLRAPNFVFVAVQNKFFIGGST